METRMIDIDCTNDGDSPAMAFEIRFELLANPGRAVVFPCDSGGRIVEDALSPRARSNLVRVSELVGRDYAYPVVGRTRSMRGMAR
jgi:hypothetical protein